MKILAYVGYLKKYIIGTQISQSILNDDIMKPVREQTLLFYYSLYNTLTHNYTKLQAIFYLQRWTFHNKNLEITIHKQKETINLLNKNNVFCFCMKPVDY